MDTKKWSTTMAVLAGAVFFMGTIAGLTGEYQVGYNFAMLSTPIMLTAIWYELKKWLKYG